MYNVGVYCIEIGGEKYIGSTLDLRHRLIQHKSNLKKQRHCNPILQNYYNKYKELKISILESFDFIEIDKLRALEKFYVVQEKAYFNIQDPTTNMFEKEVYQFDRQGNFIRKYKSVSEASIIVGIGVSTLRHAANPNEKETKTGKGYLWSYTIEPPEWKDRRRKEHRGDCKIG